ncbi:uncharacterized protein LOC132059158 [Lycium ferocissimum]|uniref:uncharacterized protein LOC132059158 n=1 Tax=Lycium ferocissimum TaxID=112874 RepID=UPI002815DE71|nr:uncharacterized protein LOC132059158 [Lycium ferocissimum]XP_059307668.1 uncharacterized protein LOC132059158 [Lycium ferocissimum]XP_059307669.1 uncharacterized protein LOC132059158 [Lycium ferocissimum]
MLLGTSKGRVAPSGGPSEQIEQVELQQRVDKMEESLNVLFAYVEAEKFRRSVKAKKKQENPKEKVQAHMERSTINKVNVGVERTAEVPRPAAEVKQVDIPRPTIVIEKVEVPRPVSKVEKLEKVELPMPTTQAEMAADVPAPTAEVEKAKVVPTHVNEKDASEPNQADVEFDSKKFVSGVLAQINCSLDK